MVFFNACGSQPIDLTRVLLLRCVHGEDCIATHDAIQDSFTSIIKDVKFHVLHAYSPNAMSLVIAMTNGYCIYNKCCHIVTNTLKMISSSNNKYIWMFTPKGE